MKTRVEQVTLSKIAVTSENSAGAIKSRPIYIAYIHKYI